MSNFRRPTNIRIGHNIWNKLQSENEARKVGMRFREFGGDFYLDVLKMPNSDPLLLGLCVENL